MTTGFRELWKHNLPKVFYQRYRNVSFVSTIGSGKQDWTELVLLIWHDLSYACTTINCITQPGKNAYICQRSVRQQSVTNLFRNRQMTM